MFGLKYMITITKREYEEDYLDFFHRHGVDNVLSQLCNGTATQSTLSLMGLEQTEKVMLSSMIREENLGEIIKGLLVKMDISSAGNGISITVPVNSIGGTSSLKYLAGEQPLQKKENENMISSESKIVLIITIVDKGNTDMVMDAAREAGARGGTTIRAKGTSAGAQKFFGLSLAEEKEIVLIVANATNKKEIMKAIMQKAGIDSKAHSLVFSLPVTETAGFRFSDEVTKE